MKIRTAVFCAASAAFFASSGLAWAAYTGQFNIVQWAGVLLGAPTAAGTSASGNILGIQGVTNGVPIAVTGSTIQAASAVPSWTSSSSQVQQVVALSGSTKVYITAFYGLTDGSAGAAGEFQLVSGTGTNCVTGQVALTPPMTFAAGQGISHGVGVGPVIISAAGQAVCVKTTTTNLVEGGLSYLQQ